MIAADYDNDGLDDLLGMIEETKQYRIRYANGGTVTKGVPFLTNGPLPGDFDGDGGWGLGLTPNAPYNLVY